jgi:hypothetical protein
LSISYNPDKPHDINALPGLTPASTPRRAPSVTHWKLHSTLAGTDYYSISSYSATRSFRPSVRPGLDTTPYYSPSADVFSSPHCPHALVLLSSRPLGFASSCSKKRCPCLIERLGFCTQFPFPFLCDFLLAIPQLGLSFTCASVILAIADRLSSFPLHSYSNSRHGPRTYATVVLPCLKNPL